MFSEHGAGNHGMMPEMGFGHVLLLLFFGFFFSLLYITHCIGAVEFDFIVIVKKYTILVY